MWSFQHTMTELASTSPKCWNWNYASLHATASTSNHLAFFMRKVIFFVERERQCIIIWYFCVAVCKRILHNYYILHFMRCVYELVAPNCTRPPRMQHRRRSTEHIQKSFRYFWFMTKLIRCNDPIIRERQKWPTRKMYARTCPLN